MSLFEVKFEIAPSDTETVDTALLELGHEAWSVLEDAIAKRAWVVGIFPSETEAGHGLRHITSLLGYGDAIDPTVRELPDTEWRDSYKAHFHAWQFGRLHWVPIWERDTYGLPPGHTALWLDPGLAFGTGNHETTRLCVERLVAHAAKNDRARVIDAGCGSGILALSAAKLGFPLVSGFDNDPEAVRVSGENAVLNGLERDVRFSVADLAQGLADVQAEIVLANILADVLVAHAPTLLAAVAPGGTLVLSGILASECAQVRAAFSAFAPGWREDSRALGEWSDIQLTRPR